jgi:hypothetical protein
MSKRTEQTLEVNEYEDKTEFSISESDFGFLIDGEGNLKTVFGPNELFDAPPETVQRILDMFGVDSAELLMRAGTTIH